MSNHSSQFFEEHPILGCIIVVSVIGGSLLLRGQQSKAAFNQAVAQCEKGMTPQHVRPQNKFGLKAQRRENSRAALINRAIDRALKSPSCRGPRW